MIALDVAGRASLKKGGRGGLTLKRQEPPLLAKIPHSGAI
jgi:hypothetical protein